MLTEKAIKSKLTMYGFFSCAFCVEIDSNRILIKSDSHDFLFSTSRNDLSIYRKKDMFNKHKSFSNKTFDDWRRFDETIRSCGRKFKELSLNKIGMSPYEYKNYYWPFLENMFSSIERKYIFINNDKPVNLIPLDNSTGFNRTKQQDWYKKLLQDYTEYTQSGSKSDIADRHYQEQANLHGLKFVVK